jgi:AcrR family transcriptional regulator
LSPTQTRRELKHQETIQAILDVSRQIMREEGAGALNLNEVARRLGLKTPSLYEYFPNKHAIYDALFRLGFQMFGERVQAIRAKPTSLEMLRASIEIYMAFAQENPELYQICFERPVPHFVPSEESLKVSLAVLGGAVETGDQIMASGEIDNSSGLTPQQMIDLTIAVSHGLTALHMANEPHLPPGQGRFGGLIEPAVELFRRAWSPPANS